MQNVRSRLIKQYQYMCQPQLSTLFYNTTNNHLSSKDGLVGLTKRYKACRAKLMCVERVVFAILFYFVILFHFAIHVMLQICGGDWAKHSTATGGFFRCNITPPPSNATSAGADSPSSQPLGATSAQAESSSGQAGLFGALMGKFTTAGAKWKLDYFMRRFVAHECSFSQLQV